MTLLADNDDEELFAERAAIREHDGGMDRQSAERAAAVDVERYRHSCEVNYLVDLGAKKAVAALIVTLGLSRKNEALQQPKDYAPIKKACLH